MKKRLQNLVKHAFGSVPVSGGERKTAEIFYNNIKLYVDGAEILPKDGKGKQAEPFIMNGTAYLPVRAVAEALGKAVEWDGSSASIYIGKKDETMPDNYLDRIQYLSFVKANKHNTLYRISGTVTDYLNKTYTNGMLFYTYSTTIFAVPATIKSDADAAQVRIDYPLNDVYKKLTGRIVLPKNIDIIGIKDNKICNEGNHAVCVCFYSGGDLLKKIDSVTTTMPFNFSIDVEGVKTLTIKIKDEENDSFVATYVALTDLALYKK